jgi:acid phosphatase
VVDQANLTITTGNPNLKPTTANNFDFTLEYNPTKDSVFEIDLFDKEFDNYIFTRTVRIVINNQIFDENTFLNSGTAYARGIELAFEEHMRFLPGPLGGLGFAANYTYVDSEGRTRPTDHTKLPFTSPNLYNVAVFYEKYGFTISLAGQYTDHNLSSVGSTFRLDQYFDSRFTLDLAASYMTPYGVGVYFNAKNPWRIYEGQANRPIQRAVYTAPSLGVPWYAILGNHDYKGRPQAQLDYAKTHPNWKMPARYFSAIEPIGEKEKVEFFFIDTSPFVEEYRDKADMRDEIVSQDTPAQVKWLDQALSNSTAAWKIVIGHHPIFSGGSEHGDQPELIRAINPVLEKQGVAAYFNGHDHDLQHIVRGSVEYFNTGAGSKVRQPGPTEGSRFYRGTPGFMAVTLTAKEMHVEVIDYTGGPLYETRVQNRVLAGA